MLWRLHIRPEPKNGRTQQDVVDFCISQNIAGIGWPVQGMPNSPADYRILAKREGYGKRPSSICFAEKPKMGDLIWARDFNGKYYLGRIQDDEWKYSNNPLHLELDIPNQRSCRWVDVGNSEYVPGKIIACFRPSAAFQSIADAGMLNFSKWLFNVRYGEKIYSDVIDFDAKDNPESFFKFINDEDCEDIVGLYLQKIKGYCLIPSTCKRDTSGYEFILKHPVTRKSAAVQVKQGRVNLDHRLNGVADEVFLFSTEGAVSGTSDNVHVLNVRDLYNFSIENTHILPARITHWLNFSKRN